MQLRCLRIFTAFSESGCARADLSPSDSLTRIFLISSCVVLHPPRTAGATIKEAERLRNFFAMISVGSKYRGREINWEGFQSRRIHIYLSISFTFESLQKVFLRSVVLGHLRVSCGHQSPGEKQPTSF